MPPIEPVDPSESSRQRHPLARGIELLTVMVDGDRDSYGVRDLAGRLDVSPSTAHRLVTDLERLGLVSRNPVGSYRLGLEFLRLAWTTTSRYPIQEVSIDTLHELTEESGESSFFGVYGEQRRQMMFALTVESPHPLRYSLPERQWIPLNAGASGLAILAFLPDEVRDEVAGGPLVAATERTLVDRDALVARLETIRRDGYSLTHGERIQGAIAIAAPVFGPGGEVAGSTGITIPEARFEADSAAALGELVRGAAAKLTGYMSGGRDPKTGIIRR